MLLNLTRGYTIYFATQHPPNGHVFGRNHFSQVKKGQVQLHGRIELHEQTKALGAEGI